MTIDEVRMTNLGNHFAQPTNPPISYIKPINLILGDNTNPLGFNSQQLVAGSLIE